MNILKKTYSKNNKEIALIEKCESPRTTSGLCIAKTILIIGVVHGDEPQGKFLIENYLDNIGNSPPHQPSPSRVEGVSLKPPDIEILISKNKSNLQVLSPHLRDSAEQKLTKCQVLREVWTGGGQKNRLLFIPCLNPDGLALKTRQNANKVDLNRNFPTKNWEGNENGTDISTNSDYFGGNTPASEIETKFVIEIIEKYKPDVILTLHAPYKVVNYDGPAKEIAEEISRIINYPTSTDIGYPTPGSFGTYAGVERNIPTITLELDEEIDVKELITTMNNIFHYLASQL